MTCLRCNTPNKCSLYGCSPNTWGAEAKPVMWQYRWLNPNGDEQPEAVLAWQTVVPNNPHIGTIQDKVAELLAYRYNGKPVYEVRPLYAGPIL